MTWKIEKPVCPTGENEEKRTQKKNNNNAMMSQSCLNIYIYWNVKKTQENTSLHGDLHKDTCK